MRNKLFLGSFLTVVCIGMAGLSSGPRAQAINLPQVTLCHNGNTQSVNVAAVPAHLAHGDTLGPCSSSSSSSSVSVSSSSASSQDSSSSMSESSSSSDESVSSSSAQSSSPEANSSSQSSASDTSSSSSAMSSSSEGASSSASSGLQETSSSSSQSPVSSSPSQPSPQPASNDGGGAQGNGSCRHGQPWCEDGSTSGQYPKWEPSHWASSVSSEPAIGGGDSDDGEHLCSFVQWMHFIKESCWERVLSYGRQP